MVGSRLVGSELLKIEDLEVTGLRVIERHGVTHIAYGRLIIRLLLLGVSRSKVGRCRPILCLHGLVVAAAGSHRHGSSHQGSKYHWFHVVLSYLFIR